MVRLIKQLKIYNNFKIMGATSATPSMRRVRNTRPPPCVCYTISSTTMTNASAYGRYLLGEVPCM